MLKDSNTSGRQLADAAKLRQQMSDMPSSLKSVMSLFVRAPDNSDKRDENNDRVEIQKLTTLSKIISENITAASDLRQITPYISKAEIIWKSLLLYPNGFQNRIFSYDTEDTKIKNASLYSELAKKVDEYYTSVYKIEEMAPDIISDVMFVTGSYMQLNISRAALEHLINGAKSVMKDAAQGTEAIKISSQGVLSYNEKLKRHVVANKGLVSRRSANAKVDGLESLFGRSSEKAENYEFGLFEDDTLSSLSGLTITDNLGVLGIQEIHKDLISDVKNKVDGTEALINLIETELDDGKPSKGKKKGKEPEDTKVKTNTLNLAQVEAIQSTLMPNRETGHKPFQRIREEEYYDGVVDGESLSIHVPSNAVALVRSQNRIQGAYLLIDSNGCFVTNVAEQNYYQKERENGLGGAVSTSTLDTTNGLIANLRQVQEGKANEIDLSEFTKLSKNLIVREMIAAVVSGQGENVTMELTPDFLEIMLSRMFKQQQTRCLYVPASTFTYFAIQYNTATGCGESLVEQAKQFISRLAALDVADTIANLEAAQPHNQMEITPEREDSDPVGTAAQARATWFSVNPTVHDIVGQSVLSIPEITDRLKAQSLTMRINSSENPLTPAPQIDLTQQEKVGFKSVDTESRNAVLNNTANTFGLQRSWLDVAEDSNNFAVEVLAEQEMLRNRTVMYSNLFARHFSDMVRKHVRVNQTLLKDLIKIIKDTDKKKLKPDHGEAIEGNDKEVVGIILRDFIRSIKVVLPSPASIESTNKLKDKIDAVNSLVNSWVEMSGAKTVFNKLLERYGYKPINGELDENDKEGNDQLEVLTAVYRMIAYKRFNIPMPFDDIMNKGKEGGIFSLVEDVRQYMTNGSLFTAEFIDTLKSMDKEFAKELKKRGLLIKEDPAQQPDEYGAAPGGASDDFGSEPGDEEGGDNLEGGDTPPSIDDFTDGGDEEGASEDKGADDLDSVPDIDDMTDSDTKPAEEDKPEAKEAKAEGDEETPPEEPEEEKK